jgi:hypothetical protein
MVMEVAVHVEGSSDHKKFNTLTPQCLIEPGKMESINVAYTIMR